MTLNGPNPGGGGRAAVAQSGTSKQIGERGRMYPGSLPGWQGVLVSMCVLDVSSQGTRKKQTDQARNYTAGMARAGRVTLRVLILCPRSIKVFGFVGGLEEKSQGCVGEREI